MRVENAPRMPVSFSKMMSATRWLAARSVAVVAGCRLSEELLPVEHVDELELRSCSGPMLAGCELADHDEIVAQQRQSSSSTSLAARRQLDMSWRAASV